MVIFAVEIKRLFLGLNDKCEKTIKDNTKQP